MLRKGFDTLLERSEYMPLEYIRKQKWSGSFQGMRFLLHRIVEEKPEDAGEASEPEGKQEKEQVFLEAIVWKEPYSFEATPEEEKQRHRFPFSEEGRKLAISWLEDTYEHHREEWRAAMKWDWERKTVEKK